MGRPELPVDHTVPERGELAAALRWVRTQAGMSYDELAAKTGLSAATLKRATSGKTVPTEETVKTFVSACGGDLYGLRRLWLDARIADRGRLAQLHKPALPQFISGRRELSAALEYFYEAAGAPSLRRLAELAGGTHLLPVSSACRIVNRQALPVSRQQMVAFLAACGLTGRPLALWGDAFQEITQSSDTDRMASKVEALFDAVTQGMTAPLRLRSIRSHPVVDGRGNPRFVPDLHWSQNDLRAAVQLKDTAAA
uniref:helix-turn-helix domain-containing protein n=1 Tax=Streptomyces sp. NBC_00998 TaxID=2903712 RepID=UPI002F907CBF|nr:helix-turn-helix domain-containing protein [Streptomyces sp. NBC_00998]